MIPWRDLTSETELDDIVQLSHQTPVGIFKHSTRCGISAMAKRGLEGEWPFDTETLPIYCLDLLKYRPLSNAVADRFGVQHQSPQLIILRDGEVAYHDSHGSISVDAIRSQLQLA